MNRMGKTGKDTDKKRKRKSDGRSDATGEEIKVKEHNSPCDTTSTSAPNISTSTTAATAINTTVEVSELGLTVTLELNNDKEVQKHAVGVEFTKYVPRHFHTRCLLDGAGETNDVIHTENNKLLLQKLAKHVFHKMMSKQNKKKKKASNSSSSSSGSAEPCSWIPTPIQLQSWPILIAPQERQQLENSSLNFIGVASTGSGKTLSYVIPLVLRASNSSSRNSDRKVYGLIITPTRELTIQVSKVLALVCKSIKSLMPLLSEEKKKRKKDDRVRNKGEIYPRNSATACLKPISSVAVYGGVGKLEQIQALISECEEKGSHNIIVTATPGRLMDIMGMGLNDQSDLDHNSFPASKGGNNGKSSDDGQNSTYENSNSTKIQTLFNSVQMFIIDEADRVAIQPDISKQVDTILSFLKTHGENQNKYHHLTMGLFSATLPKNALLKIDEWVAKPRVIVKVNSVTFGGETVEGDDGDERNGNENSEMIKSLSDDKVSLLSPATKLEKKDHKEVTLSAIPEHIEQIVHVCANHKKTKKLMTTIHKIRQNERKNQGGRRKGLIIVFFGKVKTLQYIHQLLQKENIQCVQLHSKMKQDRREFQLHLFRSGKKNILLATDIAARGIHVNNVEYIINYDFPGSLEQYVHRCGRAGRSRVTNESNNIFPDGKNATTATSMKGPKAVVYSFFHRELAPMAKDVVRLLKNCNAFVDPNLLSLIPEQDKSLGQTHQKRKRRCRNEKQTLKTIEIQPVADAYDFDSEEQEFAVLKPNRIILQRASHVSEAESDSDG